MYKVLLVTIQDNGNFGNRLQNYALQETLVSLGCDVDNLDVMRRQNESMAFKGKTAIKRALSFFGVKKYNSFIKRQNRIKGGKKFSRDNIKNICFENRDLLMNKQWNQYDCIIVGSDQVWHNWKIIPDELEYFYLTFAPREKRIAYAASFGFETFPLEDLEIHKNGIDGMRTISCRETEGCVLVKNLTGKSALKVLDPTLLLLGDQWEKIELKPKFVVPTQYLLVFFLGDIPPEYISEIEKISKEKQLVIVNINSNTDLKHCARRPEEFLWLIHRASVVCTDSFHASVFSILYNRGLRVFPRKSKKDGYEKMFGRLVDLLEPLGLLENAFGYGDRIDTNLSNKARDSFEEEKSKSILFLKNNINLCE